MLFPQADSVEVMSVGFILAVYKDENGEQLSSTEDSFLAAACFLGMLVGGLVCGLMSDRIGRRPCLLASLFINSAFAFACAFAPTTAVLITCRVLAGVGVGGSVPCVFTMAAEFVPARSRGLAINSIAACWIIGSLYASLTAYFLLGQGGRESEADLSTDCDWRCYAIWSGAPAGFAAVLAYFYM